MKRSVLAAVSLLTIGLSCTNKPENTQKTEMANLINSGGVTATKKPAPYAQTTTAAASASLPVVGPDSLVRALYQQHNDGENPFFQTNNRPLVEAFFAKKTAALIWNDAVTANGEAGKLDVDPLYNAQDTDITDFTVQPPVFQEANRTAGVLVTFSNYGQKQTIRFEFIEESGNWKISDIHYANGLHLLQLLSQ